MADEKPAPQPPLPSWEGERQHSLTGWGKSLSTAVGRKTTRNSDPELGLGSAPNKAAGVPPVAASPPSDNQSMIYRRFGELQARRLLHRRDEIARLQREPEELHDLGVRDGQPGGNLNTRNQHEQFRKRPIRNTLPQETIKRLPDYGEHGREGERERQRDNLLITIARSDAPGYEVPDQKTQAK